MQLENKFTIEAPIDKAWEALNTPETVAPCFPGATFNDYQGNTFSGTVKVKLGPVSLTYKGQGTYVSRDDDAHKVVIEVSGRDLRGNGAAEATVTGTMVPDGPGKTAVVMITDLQITGKAAQFGRGMMNDVADTVIGQFSSCLATKLAPPADGAAASTPGGPTGVKQQSPAPAQVDAIDLLGTAGAPMLKQFAPVLGAVALLLIILRIRHARG